MSNYAIVGLATGVVDSVIIWDGTESSGWAPPEGCIAVQSDTAQVGWDYADGVFTAPPALPVTPPTSEEVLATNTAERDALLAQATLAIAPLQDAVDLEDATAAEIALLKQWKQYRVAVNRVALTLPEPVWPTQP